MSHLNLNDPLILDALCQRMVRETEEFLACHLRETEASHQLRLKDRLILALAHRPACEAAERTERSSRAEVVQL